MHNIVWNLSWYVERFQTFIWCLNNIIFHLLINILSSTETQFASGKLCYCRGRKLFHVNGVKAMRAFLIYANVIQLCYYIDTFGGNVLFYPVYLKLSFALCIQTGLHKHIKKELPWSVLITRSTLANPSFVGSRRSWITVDWLPRRIRPWIVCNLNKHETRLSWIF